MSYSHVGHLGTMSMMLQPKTAPLLFTGTPTISTKPATFSSQISTSYKAPSLSTPTLRTKVDGSRLLEPRLRTPGTRQPSGGASEGPPPDVEDTPPDVEDTPPDVFVDDYYADDEIDYTEIAPIVSAETLLPQEKRNWWPWIAGGVAVVGLAGFMMTRGRR